MLNHNMHLACQIHAKFNNLYVPTTVHVIGISFQTQMAEPPTDLPEVVNDFDIEEEEIAIENR